MISKWTPLGRGKGRKIVAPIFQQSKITNTHSQHNRKSLKPRSTARINNRSIIHFPTRHNLSRRHIRPHLHSFLFQHQSRPTTKPLLRHPSRLLSARRITQPQHKPNGALQPSSLPSKPLHRRLPRRHHHQRPRHPPLHTLPPRRLPQDKNLPNIPPLHTSRHHNPNSTIIPNLHLEPPQQAHAFPARAHRASHLHPPRPRPRLPTEYPRSVIPRR